MKTTLMALCAFALGLAYLPSKAVAGDRYYNNNRGWYGISQNSAGYNHRSNTWGNDVSRWYGPENRPVYSNSGNSFGNNYSFSYNDVSRWYGRENRPVYSNSDYYHQPRPTKVFVYIPSTTPIPQPRYYYYYYRGGGGCR